MPVIVPARRWEKEVAKGGEEIAENLPILTYRETLLRACNLFAKARFDGLQKVIGKKPLDKKIGKIIK